MTRIQAPWPGEAVDEIPRQVPGGRAVLQGGHRAPGEGHDLVSGDGLELPGGPGQPAPGVAQGRGPAPQVAVLVIGRHPVVIAVVRRQLPVLEQQGLAPHLPLLGVGQVDIGIEDEIRGRQGFRRHPLHRGPVDPAALDLGQGLAQEIFPGQQPAQHQGVAFLGRRNSRTGAGKTRSGAKASSSCRRRPPGARGREETENEGRPGISTVFGFRFSVFGKALEEAPLAADP